MKRTVVTYFILAYGLSWTVFVPLALQAQGVISGLPAWLHLLGAFGPLVAAFISVVTVIPRTWTAVPVVNVVSMITTLHHQACLLRRESVSGAVLLTWLYNSTGGSVLATAIWHGTFNAGVANTEGVVAAIATAMVIGAVIIIGRRYGAEHLSGRVRYTDLAR